MHACEIWFPGLCFKCHPTPCSLIWEYCPLIHCSKHIMTDQSLDFRTMLQLLTNLQKNDKNVLQDCTVMWNCEDDLKKKKKQLCNGMIWAYTYTILHILYLLFTAYCHLYLSVLLTVEGCWAGRAISHLMKDEFSFPLWRHPPTAGYANAANSSRKTLKPFWVSWVFLRCWEKCLSRFVL